MDTSSAQRLCQKIYWGADKRTVIPTKKDAEMIADKLRERPAGEVESVVDFITGHLGFKKSLLVYKGELIKYPVSFFCSTMYDSYRVHQLSGESCDKHTFGAGCLRNRRRRCPT